MYKDEEELKLLNTLELAAEEIKTLFKDTSDNLDNS